MCICWVLIGLVFLLCKLLTLSMDYVECPCAACAKKHPQLHLLSLHNCHRHIKKYGLPAQIPAKSSLYTSESQSGLERDSPKKGSCRMELVQVLMMLGIWMDLEVKNGINILHLVISALVNHLILSTMNSKFLFVLSSILILTLLLV